METFRELHIRLTHLSEKEPLNKLSLVAIIILDVFMLGIISAGVAEQVSTLWTTSQYVPSFCQTIVIDQVKSNPHALDRERITAVSDSLSTLKYSYPSYNSYNNNNNTPTKEELQAYEHPICHEVETRLDAITNSASGAKLFSDWDSGKYTSNATTTGTSLMTQI